MSDDGYVNGEVIDSPTVNSYVVGVSIVEGDAAPKPAAGGAAATGYDPGAYTVEEVQAYVAKHPDQRAAILAAEQAGKDRVTLTESLRRNPHE